MALKYQVESLDEVDSSARSFYAETEGGFVLDVEGAAPASKTEEFVRKLRAAEKQAKALDSELRPFKELGMPAADVIALREKAESLEEQLRTSAGGSRDDLIAQIRRQVGKETEDRVKAMDTKLAEMAAKAEAAERQLQAKEIAKEARALAAKKFGIAEKWLDVIVDERVESGRIAKDPETGDLVFSRGANDTKTLAEYLTQEVRDRPELTGENTGGNAPGSRARVIGGRTIDRNDPVAMGRAAADVATGRVRPV